jgi:putative membrane protein
MRVVGAGGQPAFTRVELSLSRSHGEVSGSDRQSSPKEPQGATAWIAAEKNPSELVRRTEMIRTSILAAALAVGLAVPALAADTTAAFTQDDARQHLMHLGYTNVSQLQRDAHGNWAGTASKDGKTVPVAVKVRSASATAN